MPPERVRVSFREQPHSVLLHWLAGARRAGTALYVRGENNDKILVRPARLLSLIGVVQRDPYSSEARQNGRYVLPEFGIRIGMERTLAGWVNALKRGQLHVEYLGTRPSRNCMIAFVIFSTAPTTTGRKTMGSPI